MALMIKGLEQISKELPFKVRHLRYCVRIKNKTILEYHQMRNNPADLSVISTCCRHIPKIVFDCMQSLYKEQVFHYNIYRFALYGREKIYIDKIIDNKGIKIILSILTTDVTLIAKIDILSYKIKKINVRLTASGRHRIRRLFGNAYFNEYFQEYKNQNDMAMTFSINFIYNLIYKRMQVKMFETYQEILRFFNQLDFGNYIFQLNGEMEKHN